MQLDERTTIRTTQVPVAFTGVLKTKVDVGEDVDDIALVMVSPQGDLVAVKSFLRAGSRLVSAKADDE